MTTKTWRIFAMKVIGEAGEVSKISNLAFPYPLDQADATEPAAATLVGELLPLVTDPPLKLSASNGVDLIQLSDSDPETELSFEVSDGSSAVLEAEWETARSLRACLGSNVLKRLGSSQPRFRLSFPTMAFTSQHSMQPSSYSMRATAAMPLGIHGYKARASR